jgi:hypothetical protein
MLSKFPGSNVLLDGSDPNSHLGGDALPADSLRAALSIR